ncbi:hypothetical protein [Stenotrophomonas rhizophila]|uniref:hypothetical protein n=1 Tax=Stenotrophomonas rhizophila TaxID=216778 RepID=UPI001AEBACB5|nr:hypothetical protein [Stenotrophomonas rhizophila]
MARETKLGDIEAWNRRLQHLRANQKCTAPRFLLPFHFVTMALLLKEERAGVLSLSGPMEEYAAKLKLWEAIGLEGPVVTPGRPTGSRYHEITPLTGLPAVDVSAAGLASMLTHGGTHGSKELRNDIFTMLLELLSNCYHHARTADGLHGLACAQTWYNDTRAQFAIVDSGIGIRQSLGESADLRPRLRKENACTLACELGVSSKLGVGHAGYGLAIAKDLAMQTPNSLLFVQSCQEAMLIENRKVTEISTFDYALPGTLVVFEWDLKQPLDLANVYRQWPTDGGDDDDKPDFF